MARADRRRFVLGSSALATSVACGLGSNGSWTSLPHLHADDVVLSDGAVQFHEEIEPLVRLIEQSERGHVVDKVMGEIKGGRTYQELLAALFLAGIRNVQPRPALGFKFHCVLVVYATHQATMAASDSTRWLPLLWAIDNFKGSQATDVREGNWTMAKVDEGRLPPADKALAALGEALEAWDVEAADHAAAAAARTASRSQLLDVLARYCARDFRSIGHKSIYVAAAFRALDVIGWDHAEPIIRSLTYAILNHQGDENPAKNDYEADRAGRENWQLASQWNTPWQVGRPDPQATLDLLKLLRSSQPVPAAQAAMSTLASGVHPRSVSDGVALAAAELVMRQPGIVPLHAVTTTNAMTWLTANVGDDRLRKWLLLQNVSFLSHFAAAAQSRGKLTDTQIDGLQAHASKASVSEVFETMGGQRQEAAQAIFQLAQDPAGAHEVVRQARNLVFLKGTDAHDYKFSSAALEDYQLISPRWRAHYLAGCSYLFKAAADKDSPLAQRVLAG